MPETDPRRWKALLFICIAQLMVVLDGTIVNIALPSAQVDLGFSDGNRQWVVTAYALAFGGLLLFGGRIADLWGRKRAFTIGVIGFALASALGGVATTTGMLLGARALQGAFGALLAPAALSLITVMFTESKERAKAFGIYGAIAGGGAALGLILGGVLTEYLNWRWTLLVNIFFAIAAAAGAFLVIREPEGDRQRTGRLDIPGVVLASTGLVALVYGFTRAETAGWTSGSTIAVFAAAAALLTAFVVVEKRVKAPLLPLRVVLDRNRGGAYLSLGTAVIGMFGLFLFLTFYLQIVRGYSPVVTGLAFLPMVAGMMIGSTQIATRLATRVAPRYSMAGGFLLAAGGLLILAQITTDSPYAAVVMPGMFIMGLGLGTAFMPAMNLATLGVRDADAGVASAMVNTSQQIGGAIGTALLNTLATSATATYAASHMSTPPTPDGAKLVQLQAMVHGYSVAIYWAAGILALASVIAFVFINHRQPKDEHRPTGTTPPVIPAQIPETTKTPR
ncbi:MFS transporter [Streptomyces sp. AP-93]|uniref:MFS transporter n=1 Tax=Streptomyces sp. AP-93 TaxID=2929048 RepID=UPI001FAED0E3|nr:MFS transporter [Streptomyces sp. AP-93]MCJ0872626.1 MFS transporter [Streptomyces sp. AP-93]